MNKVWLGTSPVVLGWAGLFLKAFGDLEQFC